MYFKKSAILFFSLFLGIILTGCSDTENDVESPSNASKIYNLSITYKGKVYKVPCENDSVGNIVYLDSEFKTIYDAELANNPDIATLVLGEDSIAYFQDEKDLLKALGYEMMPLDNSTNFVDPDFPVDFGKYLENLNKTNVGKLTVWDDKNFKDRSYTAEITGRTFFSCPNLKKACNMNDKISSMKLWCTLPSSGVVYIPNGGDVDKYQWSDLRVVFLGYKDSDFKHSVLCIVLKSGEYREFANLKDIGWGDKISSIIFKIAKKDEYTSNH